MMPAQVALLFPQAAHAESVLFSDDFDEPQDLSSPFNEWDSPVGTNWDLESEGVGEGANNSASATGEVNDSSVTKTLSTAGYESIEISFAYQASKFGEDDHVIAEWFDPNGSNQWNS